MKRWCRLKTMPSRSLQYRSRSIRRALGARWRTILVLCILFAFETIYHVRSLRVEPPSEQLDAPFYTTCQEPDSGAPRANATIVMLARNADRDGAVSAVKSLEKHFNQWFHYPIVFLNDHKFDQVFIDTLTETSSGKAYFEIIDSTMWSFPGWIDQKKAARRMRAQDAAGLPYAGKPSYHHMCRFNSGFFYDHPALKKYKWYWRIEPDVQYTCDITYDPFAEMEKRGKKYGYTMALWEWGKTVPTLYRKVTKWKEMRKIKSTPLWSVLIDPSTAPWPIRKILGFSRNRNGAGDLWNMCHFWSNFEIADMDFFRSEEYREFFNFLDADGGFYYERVSQISTVILVGLICLLLGFRFILIREIC